MHLPRLLAGQALHDDAAEAPGGARALPHRARPHGHRDAAPGRALVERYLDWCGFWADFLEDRTVVDGRRVYTHERLRRRARRCRRWCRRGRCSPTSTPPWPSRPAAVDQQHDRGRGELAAEGRPAQPPGLTSVKRVKAVFWWCHAHSGDARTAREKLAAMPTDADIDFLFSVYSASRRARTEGRSGATGPCGRTSTTGTRTRSGLING